MFCVMGAYPDTLAAVNAEFFVDPGFAILHTDCLGGTALEAVDAALAQFLIQTYGMVKLVHAAFHLQMSFRCQNSHISFTSMVIFVPTPSSVSIFMSSVYFFIFGSPIPAPKPRFLTSSGAVE